MARADASARPPINSAGDAQALNRILHPGMGESDWSVEPTFVDEHGVHILATCHCEECLAIRASSAPSPAEKADMERLIEEDEAETRRRASWQVSPGLAAWYAANFPPKERSA